MKITMKKSVKYICGCVDVDMGSYSNQMQLRAYWNGRVICVDSCLVPEIVYLWSFGVRTTGCCCGHNKVRPMINVIPEHHDKMMQLGYKHWINEFGTYCYAPLSIIKK